MLPRNIPEVDEHLGLGVFASLPVLVDFFFYTMLLSFLILLFSSSNSLHRVVCLVMAYT